MISMKEKKKRIRKVLSLSKNYFKEIRLYFIKKITLKKFDLNDFKNKRIAIIGPANSAIENELGSYIDGFDIVVRINKSIDVVDKYAKFIGNKTTVLFHGLDETPKTGCGSIETTKWKKKGVKKVYYPLNIDKFYLNLTNYFKKNSALLPISQIDKALYDEISYKLDNFIPTTGFAAIYILLSSNFKELYISGFTFFKTNHLSGYREDLKDNSEAILLMKQYGNHDPEREFELFKKMIKNNKRNIKLDTKLLELLYG